ncbi:MAG TPA: bacteriohemerythrin [Planctomycetota bacterium]|jgi:hemerythrin|nr:hemerythrin family protein [Planctomycetota bacterium]OQC21385.1 MAG: Bacteriohemerythrin [Planctomycetes bacterium ADurb.Bin069]NMD36969.1 hemerythrin family protein [Planctomycetota bacterium]HNR97854.1 bacteriohemerythrin [Planctomycetota bacterium]HNU24679.1 bacteriohemerythrin [Planctomycetota bacterium]
MDWGEKLATGVSELDDRHRELVERINTVLEGIDQMRGQEMIGAALDEFGGCALDYFREEETFLRAAAYPDYERHRDLHDGFVREFQEMRDRFDVEGASLLVISMVQHGLIKWLLDHIAEADKEWIAAVYQKDDAVPA